MKRFLSLTLALLMVLGSATVLFSCKKDKKEGTATLSATDKQLEEGTIFYERAQVSDNLPAKDFGGRSFRIAAYQPNELFVEEEERGQGDLIKDARASRNTVVETRFNAKIDIVFKGTYTEVDSYAQKAVLSSSDEFDLYYGMVMSAGGMAIKNLFLNWYSIPYIDFSQPWWYDSNATDLTYNGKAILAISHLNYSAVAGSYCLFFNKDLANSYELGDLYSTVINGKWTFDKLQSLVKDVYQDNNGNSERDENDFYGFSQLNGTGLNSYLWAFDNPVCTKNAEGVPEISVNTDKAPSIVTKLYDFLYNTNGVFFDIENYNEKSIAGKLFYDNRAIFMLGSLGSAAGESLRNFESDYGILPLPKWDESQASYKTMVGGHHSAMAVPKTAQDLEFIGIMVEALSAESWKLVTPTLYEIALKNRYLRDDQSKLIMDYIIEGTQFDFGTVYDNWQGFAFMLERLMTQGNSNFESYFRTQRTKAKYQYKQVVRAFDKL